MHRKFLRTNILPIALVFIVLILALNLLQTHSQKSIKIHDDQIEIQKLNNAIVQLIIEVGYGYKVEIVEATIKELHKLLITGDIDLTMELWKENNLLWYENALEKGFIDDLGIIYNGGKQYWIVSEWFALENEITSVSDMKKHWQAFVDPEDPSKGLFLNCIVGWPCRDINNVKLTAYGLDKYYNTVSPVSPESLKSIYENSYTKKLPLFGYYWEPNAIMANMDWKILDEPPYQKEIWKNIIESLSSPDHPQPDEACSYNESGVHIIANSGLRDNAPEIVEFLQEMEISYQVFNALLFDQNKSLAQNDRINRATQLFFRDYQHLWSKWLPAKVRKKIEKHLHAEI